jgi:outer membrane protein OmpA-like peptidoglycan-associated protein
LSRRAILILALLGAGCASQQPSLNVPVQQAAIPHPVRPHPVRPQNGRLSNVANAGPLKMAMVGSYMDAQERDFRMRLRGQEVTVVRIGDEIVVGARNDALFSGEQLSGRGKSVLERVAELVRHYDHSAIQVSGFMDAGATPDESYALSGVHAKTIAAALVADGVPAERISAQGFGATHPRFPVGPNAKEPRNRRIEIHVVAHATA